LNNIWSKINQLFKSALFPQACLLCKAPSNNDLGLCQACLNDLPWHSPSSCPQCGLNSYEGQRCGACITASPDFDTTKALFNYEFPINLMLQQYKYKHSLPIAQIFASLMLRFKSGSKFDLIIPMPLHPQRLKERGFNQSLEIARLLSKPLEIPVRHVCERIKFSAPQASLPMKDRVKNMKGAFICNEDLSGRNVILVDDVMTTGASLNALAKAVKAKGAAHVECWLIARTLPK
jgi:ComF family protein